MFLLLPYTHNTNWTIRYLSSRNKDCSIPYPVQAPSLAPMTSRCLRRGRMATPSVSCCSWLLLRPHVPHLLCHRKSTADTPGSQAKMLYRPNILGLLRWRPGPHRRVLTRKWTPIFSHTKAVIGHSWHRSNHQAPKGPMWSHLAKVIPSTTTSDLCWTTPNCWIFQHLPALLARSLRPRMFYFSQGQPWDAL